MTTTATRTTGARLSLATCLRFELKLDRSFGQVSESESYVVDESTLALSGSSEKASG